MSTHGPDYSREPMQIWESYIYEVYDPWVAQVRGTFPTRAEAELFLQSMTEKIISEQRVVK